MGGLLSLLNDIFIKILFKKRNFALLYEIINHFIRYRFSLCILQQ